MQETQTSIQTFLVALLLLLAFVLLLTENQETISSLQAEKHSCFMIYVLYEAFREGFHCSVNCLAQKRTCLFIADICFLVIPLGRLLVKRQDYVQCIASDTI